MVTQGGGLTVFKILNKMKKLLNTNFPFAFRVGCLTGLVMMIDVCFLLF